VNDLAKKKAVLVTEPCEPEVDAAVTPLAEPTSLVDQFNAILATMPHRPTGLTSTLIDPEREMAMHFDPAYNAFAEALRRFRDECLTQ
jgi:hypothetical protein